MAGAQSLRVRTVSGSAVNGSKSAVEGSVGWGGHETVESINATTPVSVKWGGDMRTNHERERDRNMEREREAERQRMARASSSSWQNLSS
jgi:hypothetical protein